MSSSSKPESKSPNPQPRGIGETLNTLSLPTSLTSGAQPSISQQIQTPSHKPKPSLKLNMKGQNSPAPRSLSSIASSIPNFTNSGPFSPGLFTSRRVWVKRPHGTATTLTVNQNDIIDDLKSGIMSKFPNALAKYYDPADITIKMDLHSRKQAVPTSTTNSGQPSKKVNIWNQSVSPETSKPSSSPISSTFKDANMPVSSTQPHNFGFINLEPDQHVWNLLDLYFPGGMNMNEAFIIETPILDDPIHHHREHSEDNHSYYPGGNSNLAGLYHNSGSPSNAQNQSFHSYNRSLTPNSVNSATNSNFYHQPKPQYLHGNSTALYKDRSVSPANSNTNASTNPNNKVSPLPSVNLHRRSHSNPPQSPVSNPAAKYPSVNSISGNSGSNNNAVLLLPKNFSLSQQGTQVEKKRLSLDENFVSKNRERLNHSPSVRNITNLNEHDEGLESAESFETLKESKPESSSPKSDNNGKMDELLQSPSTPPPGLNNNSNMLLSPSRMHSNDSKDKRNSDDSSSTSNNNNNNKNNSKNNNNGNKKPESKEKGDDTKVVRKTSGSKKNDTKNKSATETVLPSISVLVVEDNAINQAILGAFLRKHKIHYEIAKNGQEAIAKWRTGGFHLVLMDIQLPVKSGIEATKEIRYLERVNRIGVFAENELHGPKPLTELSDEEKLDLNIFRSPVIIVALTASSNSSVDRSNALRAGCNDYLTKPVNLVWLQNKITEWGCMQALIDFDGWKTKRSNFGSNSAKILAQNTRNRSRSSSQSKVLLGGSSQRQQQKQLKT